MRRAALAPQGNDYALVEALMDDLQIGNVVDLATVGIRVRDIYDTAFQAGAIAQAHASTDGTVKLAAENRRLRMRLVQQSLTDGQVTE